MGAPRFGGGPSRLWQTHSRPATLITTLCFSLHTLQGFMRQVAAVGTSATTNNLPASFSLTILYSTPRTTSSSSSSSPSSHSPSPQTWLCSRYVSLPKPCSCRWGRRGGRGLGGRKKRRRNAPLPLLLSLVLRLVPLLLRLISSLDELRPRYCGRARSSDCQNYSHHLQIMQADALSLLLLFRMGGSTSKREEGRREEGVMTLLTF